ncbi:MAG TPA: hypothetical protein DCW33_01060 [Proteobacteria bacterium]|nr:hypothetical protein [Pseudomonadota bacterium]
MQYLDSFDYLRKATRPIPSNELSLSALQPEAMPWDHDRPDLIDPATGYLYPYQPTALVWSKHLVMLIPSLVFHMLAMPLLVLSDWRASCYYMFSSLVWYADGCVSHGNHQLKSAIVLFLSSFLKPFALLGILSSHVIGLVAPQVGRKLYASLERHLYWSGKLIPSFQPYCIESTHDGCRIIEPRYADTLSTQAISTPDAYDDTPYASCFGSLISSYDLPCAQDLQVPKQYRACPPESYESESTTSMVVC